MFPGISDLLKELLHLGHLLVLNTNAYEYNCLPLLEYSGIKLMFDFVATADLSRNKTEKFKFIEDKHGLDKKDILFITDALGDIREADLAGIPTVAVTWGVHDRSYFTRESHNNLIGVVDTVDEIKDYI
jgi:phosphoglycolate phosphatase-like HAD superfamily hydrolase